MSSDEWEKSGGFDIIVEDRIGEDINIEKPKMYKVIMLNDDYTPFDFVSAILCTIFRHTEESSQMIAREVHDKGKAVAGTFTRDIADTKSATVNHQAQENAFPFKTIVEAE